MMGTSAPISEPVTSSRMNSVSGMAMRPARASCESNSASSFLSVEVPADAM